MGLFVYYVCDDLSTLIHLLGDGNGKIEKRRRVGAPELSTMCNENIGRQKG